MEEPWFRAQWNIPSWSIAPMEKAWFYKRLFFEMVMVTVKDIKTSKKIQCQSKNQFYGLHEVNNSNAPTSFQGI